MNELMDALLANVSTANLAMSMIEDANCDLTDEDRCYSMYRLRRCALVGGHSRTHVSGEHWSSFEWTDGMAGAT